MSDNIRIVPSTEGDLPSIKPLLSELMDVMANTEGIDVEQSFKNCCILIKDPDHHMLVAKDKDVIVGFISFTMRKTIVHLRPSGLVDELIVSKSYRGRGIGKQLISAAMNTCRELGCSEVEVSTEKSNTRAREFYQKCGFEEDAVLLEMDLDERLG
ncbi:MAG: GNAT family N-acetyltransferase [Deltaproteobacteria bacterium]|nr:GNAT family N-acetyltransferase [Deltaproteobacteria bacterium]